MLRLGFTGTQKGMTDEQKEKIKEGLKKLKKKHREIEVHHGDCIGSDEEFHEMVREVFPKAKIIAHPGYSKEDPDDDSKRAYCEADEVREPRPFLDRNKEGIVAETDVLWATPSGRYERMRSGTWSTVRYRRKAGGVTGFVFPDGSTLKEKR